MSGIAHEKPAVRVAITGAAGQIAWIFGAHNTDLRQGLSVCRDCPIRSNRDLLRVRGDLDGHATQIHQRIAIWCTQGTNRVWNEMSRPCEARCAAVVDLKIALAIDREIELSACFV